jgi:monoamine oxidase
MSRTDLFARVSRALRAAEFCEKHGVSTKDALDRARTQAVTPSRREFLGMLGGAGLAGSPLVAHAGRSGSSARIAIVGGGLAGLACADALQRKGVTARLYEANTRLGGRCFSNRTLIPGMVCENGGEFLDTGHRTMLAYANEFGLARESVSHKIGEERFWFFGQPWTEEQIID